MNIVNQISITIPAKNIQAVVELLRVNKVKHAPFSKQGEEYIVTVEDSPFASFLQLRYHEH